MSSRPFLCPACHKSLGTMTRWAYKGTVHAKLRMTNRSASVGRNWSGVLFVHCPCGKKVRLPEDVEVSVR
jgi:hypothetical protein